MIKLSKDERINQYGSRIIESVHKFDYARHLLSTIEQERALFSKLPNDFDVTAKTIVNSDFDYHLAALSSL